jgi:MFS family permease
VSRTADVSRPTIPKVIAQLLETPLARNGLLAGSAALVAAALDPKVWGPTLPSVQAAIRERPGIETLVLLAALGGSALLLVGGAIGDSARARRIIVGGLTVELVAALVSVIVGDGWLFVASRLVGHAAAAFIIPAALAMVATSYDGVARATAIGIAYGAYGAAGAAAPILLQLVPGVRLPAFVVAIVGCLFALRLIRGRIPDLARPVSAERPYVVGTAIWAFGVITLTVGLTWIRASWDDPLRIGLVVAGLAILGLAFVHDRRRVGLSAGSVRIERRPAAIAVVIGVILGIAQTAPMLQLPLYFQLVMAFSPVLAVVALVPLFGALVLAGPVAGFMLARWSPRRLVAAGAIAVGLGNLLLAAAITGTAGYLLFILPCFLVGAGFVIATTRTAIIFASVPRGLPATAAALNEASISIGNRIGIVLVTVLVAEAAIAAFGATLTTLPAAEATAAAAAFRDVLVAVGTPSFSQIAAAVEGVDVPAYRAAYATGVGVALAVSGAVVVIGGVVAWLALGHRDPLATIYEHRDERGEGALA